MFSRELREPDLAVLAMLCWLVVAAQLVVSDWSTAARTMSDTDDALRLVQMRAFLAGQGWFDLHQARLGPPAGYDSHWSRLIDAGLAGLFLLFRPFTDAARAEFLMRIVWPLLWLIPAIAATLAIAYRIAGHEAARVALILIAIGMPAFEQFRPGRIDHHNVQIALALAALAAAAWSGRSRFAAVAAGALTGLALAIGLEGYPFVMLAGAGPALAYVVDARRDVVRDYGLALAAATLAAFLVSVGPSSWSRTACDAIALNWTAPIVLAGALLAFLGSLPAPGRRTTRTALVAVVAVAAAVVFVAGDPRCLRGPYALMDPGVRDIWLMHVKEMQPLARLIVDKPIVGIPVVAFPAVTCLAVLVLVRRPDLRRNPAFLLIVAAFIVALAMTLAAAKMFSYAMWLGMPLVAAASLTLFARYELQPAMRTLAAVLVAPAILSAAASLIVGAAGARSIDDDGRAASGCFDSTKYAPLAALPKGVVASEIDYGPFILALTPHAVIAAPYHRLGAGIRTSHQIFTQPPEAARRVVDAHGVDYLVTCDTDAPASVTAGPHGSVLERMAARDLPDWLEKLPAASGQIFTVYRVRRDRDAAPAQAN